MSVNSPYLLESVQEILLTALYTACVRNAVPVSILTVADSGTAKSKLLKCFHSPNDGPAIHHTDSFSSQGLFTLMQNDTQGKLRWIVTPDMNPTLSRPMKTVTATVANLLTLTMDGTCRIDDGRQEKILRHHPIGLLSAVTPDMYHRQARKWFQLGLTRRIIPIFYGYTHVTIQKLLSVVREGKISGGDFPEMTVDLDKDFAPAIGETESLRIESLGTQLAGQLGLQRGKDSVGKEKWFINTIVPISPVVVLRTLASAHAIRDKRGAVNEKDIDFLVKFIDFTNPSFPKQI